MISNRSWLILTLFLAGCGSAKKAPVKGQIVYEDGTPVTGLVDGEIVFEPVNFEDNNYSAYGIIDAQGNFTLRTEKANDGAIVGENRVLIKQQVINPERPPPKVIEDKYEKFETSGITVNVEPGKENNFTIKVTRHPRARRP